MEVVLLLLCATLLSGAQGIKKCRIDCNKEYKPVCGHDKRLGYLTFCSPDALGQCNQHKGNSYVRVADGPCYHSVRGWNAQSSFSGEQQPLGKGRKLEETKELNLDVRNNTSPAQDVG